MTAQGLKFSHEKFTALCVLLNSETSAMSVAEYDEFVCMIYNMRNKLEWIAERKGCMSCKYFEKGCTKADGKLPPEKIQKSGCEMYENKFVIPF